MMLIEKRLGANWITFRIVRSYAFNLGASISMWRGGACIDIHLGPRTMIMHWVRL